MEMVRFRLRVRNWSGAFCGYLILSAIGCSSQPYEVVPVSGTVTLGGQPLPGATIKFAPKGAREVPFVGPGSIGKTDDEGRYKLNTFKDERGAVVGLHRVTISTFEQRFIDLRRSEDVETISEERVPPHYNKRSILTFDVPAGGTNEADFLLTLEKP